MWIAFTTCVTACFGDILAVWMFGLWYPGYNQFKQAMSVLGASGSPVSKIVSLWWVIVGLLFIIFAIGYHQANVHKNKVYKQASIMIGLYGFGEGIGSGLFPGNHLAGHLTGIGIIHNLLGGAGVAGIIILPLFIIRIYRRRYARSWMISFSWLITCTGILFFTLFSICRLAHTSTGFFSYAGFWQRFFMLNYYLYMFVLAIIMLRENRQEMQANKAG
jgi:hypothetical protein